MDRSFFYGFGDEIVKLAADVPAPVAKPIAPYSAPKVAPSPTPTMSQFKSQQEARRGQSLSSAISKLPGMAPVPKATQRAAAEEALSIVPKDKGRTAQEVKELRDYQRRKAAQRHRDVVQGRYPGMPKARQQELRGLERKVFGKDIKSTSETGRAQWSAEEATRKTLGNKKLTERDIVSRYALGKSPRSRGRRRIMPKAKGSGSITRPAELIDEEMRRRLSAPTIRSVLDMPGKAWRMAGAAAASKQRQAAAEAARKASEQKGQLKGYSTRVRGPIPV